jgi:hypothetical protein
MSKLKLDREEKELLAVYDAGKLKSVATSSADQSMAEGQGDTP